MHTVLEKKFHMNVQMFVLWFWKSNIC